MTTEELRELGLSEEQIPQVMKLNGQAIENVKSELTELKQQNETLVSEKENLTQQMEAVTGKLDSLKKLEGADKTISELNTKIEELKNQHTAEKQMLDKKQRATLRILEENPHEVSDILNLINLEEVELTDNGLFGLDSKIAEIKENKPYLFKSEGVLQGEDPNGAKQRTQNNPTTYDDFLRLVENE